MTDLSLIPLDDLMKEAENRCDTFICAYSLPKEKEKTSWFRYGKGTWGDSCRLGNILNNDILNNWNDELKTLQRINEEN